MKYVIAHLIRGEAQKLHETITHNLTEKFDTAPLFEYIVPHITLKRSFERDENRIDDIYRAIDAFAETHAQTDYSLKGFGNFNEVAVYIGVHPSEEMKQSVKDLQGTLEEVEGIELDEFDRAHRFHATVALGKLKPFSLEEVWNYVQALEVPDFSMKFDNVTVLKKIDGKWVIDRITEIKPNL